MRERNRETMIGVLGVSVFHEQHRHFLFQGGIEDVEGPAWRAPSSEVG